MLLRKVEYSLCLSKESSSGDGVESFGKNGTRTGLALPTPSEHFPIFSQSENLNFCPFLARMMMKGCIHNNFS